MEDIRKRLLRAAERIDYLIQIKGDLQWGNLVQLQDKQRYIYNSLYDFSKRKLRQEVRTLEDGISFLEQRCEESLTPMERVSIVRSPLRFSLQDILENVYEDYTELGGEEEANIDPSMVCAKATIIRRVKDRSYTQQVMVIGHEKGHGEEYRNGGSSKPWGNAKALHFMQVAQTEGIPIHSYIFTPGSFPIEEYPGAAQQIAANLYTMTKLKVPIISVISEGGSGGAEAIGLSDYRLMFSHGYYSVISPEGAAAIEGKIREGNKIPRGLVEDCAARLKITARDNLELGNIDRIIEEPVLGARRDDFAFFKKLRFEMIRATDEVVLSAKSFRVFRVYAVKLRKHEEESADEQRMQLSWELNRREIKRIVQLRSQRYRKLATAGFGGELSPLELKWRRFQKGVHSFYYNLRYDLFRSKQKQVRHVIRDVSGEGSMLWKHISGALVSAYDFLARIGEDKGDEVKPVVSNSISRSAVTELGETYTSPLANEDRTITCPRAEKYGCLDLWVPDLYGEFCGVCENCGHHFPLEYHWYISHLFDQGSVCEFNREITSGNPLQSPGFEKRLQEAKERTRRNSAIITFEAKVMGIELVVAILYSDFRNGTVGSAEGEKFVRACDLAMLKRRPLLAYVHSTGGIRIQEGTIGVVQMPKCTMAVREYVDSGGLYIVVYDNNSYAGPVASFLGCSHYQFAIRSSRIGFAGPRVIRDTTGEDIPPDYHSVRNALRRGHIHGIWDRREFRVNLHKALMTMGGSSLYYR
ncbi:MAG: carboxyl transferase domain-containing protein [Thermodesulfobacteriota bacterium]